MRRVAAVTIGFFALLVAFWFVGGYFGVATRLGDHLPSALVSFALLLAPYWGFGFGIESWLRRKLTTPLARLLAPLALLLPYLVFVIPRGEFRWTLCAGFAAVILLVTGILSRAPVD